MDYVTEDKAVVPLPEVGSEWLDAEGQKIVVDKEDAGRHKTVRHLTVDHVEPNDRDGREVRGWIEYGPGYDAKRERYATSLKIFWHVWRPAG